MVKKSSGRAGNHNTEENRPFVSDGNLNSLYYVLSYPDQSFGGQWKSHRANLSREAEDLEVVFYSGETNRLTKFERKVPGRRA